MQLRDSGITDVPFVLIYDFIQLMKKQQKFLHFSFAKTSKKYMFHDAFIPETYETDCLYKLLVAPYYQEIRDIFLYEGVTNERLIFFLEQLLEGNIGVVHRMGHSGVVVLQPYLLHGQLPSTEYGNILWGIMCDYSTFMENVNPNQVNGADTFVLIDLYRGYP